MAGTGIAGAAGVAPSVLAAEVPASVCALPFSADSAGSFPALSATSATAATGSLSAPPSSLTWLLRIQPVIPGVAAIFCQPSPDTSPTRVTASPSSTAPNTGWSALGPACTFSRSVACPSEPSFASATHASTCAGTETSSQSPISPNTFSVSSFLKKPTGSCFASGRGITFASAAVTVAPHTGCRAARPGTAGAAALTAGTAAGAESATVSSAPAGHAITAATPAAVSHATAFIRPCMRHPRLEVPSRLLKTKNVRRSRTCVAPA